MSQRAAQSAVTRPAGFAAAPQEVSPDRVLLARRLSNLIMRPASQITANERSLAADMLLQVIAEVEPDLRAEISEHMAKVVECPPALVRMLLCDSAEVARPLLTDAEALPEALLIDCARDCSPEHRKMIAARKDLTTALVDILVQSGDSEVIKAVLRRDDVVLSPNSVERLVGLSMQDETIQAALLRRQELEPAHGFLMFWWVSGERRQRILARFALDRLVIQEALSDLFPRVHTQKNPDPVVKEILRKADRRHRARGPNGEAITFDMIDETLRMTYRLRTAELIRIVASISMISEDLATRIVHDKGGEPFAILCKALGVPRHLFSTFHQPVKGDEEGEARADYMQQVFDTIARDFARAIVRYWDWKGNPRLGVLGATSASDLDD